MSNSLTIVQPPIKTKLVSHSELEHSLIIEPLMPGFGYTLGNSLRRILLYSVPGYAVTRIKINDISHEYQAVEGVKEDGLDIVLNLKAMNVRVKTGEEKITLTLNKSGGGEVLAGDFDTQGKCEVVNKDLYICTLDGDGEITIEVDIAKGTGYMSTDRLNLSDNINPQNILVDALFSPVTNVRMEVDDIRVGEATNYNMLKIDFTTDGTVDPKEIVDYTLDLIVDLFQKIKSSFTVGEVAETKPEEGVVKVEEEKLEDEIKLSKKILGILSKNDITTNAQLKTRKEELENLSGVDEKMIKDINEYLASLEA